MRSSEEMAYAIYLADCTYDMIGTPGSSVVPRSWDELDYEEEQKMYLRHVDAVIRHLFEHGRISSYLNDTLLEKYRQEYRAYLRAKQESNPPASSLASAVIRSEFDEDNP